MLIIIDFVSLKLIFVFEDDYYPLLLMGLWKVMIFLIFDEVSTFLNFFIESSFLKDLFWKFIELSML
jgi:hypothetical protein